MNALVSYHAIKLGEYMCKPPFCRPVYINMTWLSRPSMPVYNAAADSSVCATFKSRGRLCCPSLTAWSTSTYRAAPVCMSCLLGMRKSQLGWPGFLSNWRQIIINRRLHWMVQWAGAQVAATTVLINFKLPVGRNNWPSC